MKSIRSNLYNVAKLLGDANAVQKGPKAMIRRVARKQTGKMASRGMGKGFGKIFK